MDRQELQDSRPRVLSRQLEVGGFRFGKEGVDAVVSRQVTSSMIGSDETECQCEEDE